MGKVAREVINGAVLICGGVRPLCARLGVGAAKLYTWPDGEDVPASYLAKAIEILIDDYDAWRLQDRRTEPRRSRTAKRSSADVV